MNPDGRLSLALHALLHLAVHAGPVTSDALGESMGANPVVVRRTMAGLREAGLVRSAKGHGGGWSVARDPSAITLRDVHAALGEPTLLAVGLRSRGPDCAVERVVHGALGGALAEAETVLLERLGAITLARLADDLRCRVHGRPPEPE